MNISLKGQTALVTGGNTGIGAAICEALGEAGANVVINYHSHKEQADELAARIDRAGAKAIAIQGDVSSEEHVINMVRKAVETFGGLDIMCPNAGIQADASLLDMTLAQWKKVIDVNLTGAFLCAREAARQMVKQGVTGRSAAAGKIIFTSSVHELIPWEEAPNYTASKGGMQMLMKSIAQDLAEHKIRVNAIGPGSIKTKINKEAWETEEKERQEIEEFIPYGRWGVPMDIGKVAAWLASDESDYVVGTTIYVDGGMLLYPSFRG